MKIVSIILILAGAIGTVVFGVQAINDSESFNLFGLDIAVSSANWTPLIISGIVLVAGILMRVSQRN